MVAVGELQLWLEEVTETLLVQSSGLRPGLSELFGKDNPFLNIMTRLVYASPRR